jgi:hypothetical protein
MDAAVLNQSTVSRTKANLAASKFITRRPTRTTARVLLPPCAALASSMCLAEISATLGALRTALKLAPLTTTVAHTVLRPPSSTLGAA